jgi:FMN phosphatase YigB (HAD superfamily)
MPTLKPIEFVFFDIGGTLGERNSAGDFAAFSSTRRLLSTLRDKVGLRLGIITSLGDLTDEDGRRMLEGAGLAEFLDPDGFVSDHNSEGVSKPMPAIYRLAAEKVGVPIEKCLYISEDFIEVVAALAAGMQAVLKPCPPGRELGS